MLLKREDLRKIKRCRLRLNHLMSLSKEMHFLSSISSANFCRAKTLIESLKMSTMSVKYCLVLIWSILALKILDKHSSIEASLYLWSEIPFVEPCLNLLHQVSTRFFLEQSPFSIVCSSISESISRKQLESSLMAFSSESSIQETQNMTTNIASWNSLTGSVKMQNTFWKSLQTMIVISDKKMCVEEW